jgi:hypothetical protein
MDGVFGELGWTSWVASWVAVGRSVIPLPYVVLIAHMREISTERRQRRLLA